MLTPHIRALLATTRLLVVAVEREKKQKELNEQQKYRERESRRSRGLCQSVCIPLRYLQIMIVVGYFPALDLGQTEIGYVDF